MRKDLDEKLCKTYPFLYQHRNDLPNKTLMHWGFSCFDGWYSIIDSISALLTNHNKDIRASQVKEKFGGLRYYCHSSDYYSRGIIDMAQTISCATCEECGAPGNIYNANQWMATRCLSHATLEQISGEYHQDTYTPIKGIGIGWSRLVMLLKKSVDWHANKNNMPKVILTISKSHDRLAIDFIGGNNYTRGMVDFINYYSYKLDQDTGYPINFQ